MNAFWAAVRKAAVFVPRVALPGKQHRTRAFIKVQDGCDNLCTFCLTRLARGASRSQPREEIFADIRAALEGDVKEIVLTGVNLGAWGRDLPDSPRLPSLIKEVVKIVYACAPAPFVFGTLGY